MNLVLQNKVTTDTRKVISPSSACMSHSVEEDKSKMSPRQDDEVIHEIRI